jgi:hypothetical protein
VRWLNHSFFENQPREFIDILLYCKNNNIAHDKLEDTVCKVNRLCPGDVSTDKVIALLGNQPEIVSTLPEEAKKTDEIEDLSFKHLQ